MCVGHMNQFPVYKFLGYIKTVYFSEGTHAGNDDMLSVSS